MRVTGRFFGRQKSAGGVLPAISSVADVERLTAEANDAEDRYAVTGDLAALNAAIRAREAVVTHPAVRLPDEVRATLLNGIGTASLQRYWATGSDDDLGRAVQS